MVKYRITGPDAAAFLDRLTHPQRRRSSQSAHVHYTAWCDDDGKLLDDGTLFRHGADRLPALLPGAPPAVAPRQRHRLRRPDRGDHRGDRRPLAPGPDLRRRPARRRLRRRSRPCKPFQLARVHPRPASTLTISRTGFTGDLGYELWTTPDRALELWDPLMEAGALHGIRADRHQRPQPRPHRGRLHHHQHGLRPRRHRGPRRPRPLALRARPRLDDRLRQGPLQRPPRAPRREGQGLRPGPSSASTSTATSRPTTPSSTTARSARSATSPPPPGRRRPSATSRSPTSAAPTTPRTATTSGSRSTPCASCSTPS